MSAGSAGRPAVIEAERLGKDYVTAAGPYTALDGVDLSIAEGEFVAIMGPSGSGKSTLMNLVGCLDTPTGGQYLCDGIDVATLDREQLAELRRDKIGQDHAPPAPGHRRGQGARRYHDAR